MLKKLRVVTVALSWSHSHYYCCVVVTLLLLLLQLLLWLLLLLLLLNLYTVIKGIEIQIRISTKYNGVIG